MIENKFKEFDKRGVDLVDFVKIFLTCFDHQDHETIYIVISLIEFYKTMLESLGLEDYVKFTHFTNFIVENFIEKNNNNYVLPTKKLAEPKHFERDISRIREIDLSPPIVYGKSNVGIKRILTNKIETDSHRHNNSEIKSSCYSPELKKLFTLDALSNHIKIYDKDCKFESCITPKSSKNNRDLIIINFAFSHKSLRLGACLKNYTLSFWDAGENFQFEKVVNTSFLSPDYQNNIWFIDFMNAWATADKKGKLHVWDLLSNEIKQTYSPKDYSKENNSYIID